MIGQDRLKKSINTWRNLPMFMIIEGSKGSGRKTLVRYIAKRFEADSIVVGTSVEDVRNIIQDAQSIFKPRIYVIDGNALSMAALNSLLKIAEEPPQNCHIAMIVDSINNALPTLASRAKTLTMLPYTTDDKLAFIQNHKRIEKDNIDSRTLVDYCLLASNLAMLDEILTYGAEEIFEKVTTFFDLIWGASESNSLKVTNWLKFKDSDTDKIEPILFFKCLLNWSSVITMREGTSMSFDEIKDHDRLVREASTCLRKIQRRGANARIYVNRFLRKVKAVE